MSEVEPGKEAEAAPAPAEEAAADASAAAAAPEEGATEPPAETAPVAAGEGAGEAAEEKVKEVQEPVAGAEEAATAEGGIDFEEEEEDEDDQPVTAMVPRLDDLIVKTLAEGYDIYPALDRIPPEYLDNVVALLDPSQIEFTVAAKYISAEKFWKRYVSVFTLRIPST
jgi:hypothetical protein